MYNYNNNKEKKIIHLPSYVRVCACVTNSIVRRFHLLQQQATNYKNRHPSKQPTN
ncbi:hypothetical protein DOY81_002065 [Sarcophaga bullata]|nr:hypothetical protein DOY81_002065 [Sarcophaga bullata]